MKLYGKSLCTSSIVAMLLIISVMVPMVAEVAEAEINSTGTYFWVDPPNISPPNINKTVCDQFEVNIMIENAPTTWSWEATLNFDNNTLGVMSITKGTWLSTGAGSEGTDFFYTSLVEANKTGTVSFGETLKGEAPGASGNGTLCTITFHVEECGRSPLNLTDTALLDMNLKETDYPNNDGFFCATCSWGCLDDIAIVDVRVNVTAVVDQGAIIEVNVTIHNEGNHTNEAFWVNATAEMITHDPLDPDVVLVGDEILIGGQLSPLIEPCNYTSFYFNWNTTTVPGETYTICAEVIKPADDDPHDNVFIGPVVRVRCPHDLKIIDATVLLDGHTVEGPNLIGVAQGLTVKINVTVLNEGSNSETFDIVVHADGINTTHSVTTALATDEQKTYTVNWDTTGVTPDIYDISAEVTPVTGEKDTADNGPIEADEKIWVLIDDGAVAPDTTISKETYRGFVVSCADISGGLNVTVKNQGTRHYSSFVYIIVSGTEIEICVGVVTVPYERNQTVWTWYPSEELNTTDIVPGTYDVFAILGIAEKELDTLDNNVSVGTLKIRKWGDVNNDDKVSASDIVKIILIIGGDIPKPYYPPYMPDVNNDDKVSASDIVKIILIIGKKIGPIYPG